MEEPNFDKILKSKIEHYGNVIAAYQFAGEEYARQLGVVEIEDLFEYAKRDVAKIETIVKSEISEFHKNNKKFGLNISTECEYHQFSNEKKKLTNINVNTEIVVL